MDWKTLIAQNASALIGFIGAIIGVAVGAIISFLLQYQQRRWVLDDQLRQWKRQRLTEHITPIQDWINIIFRMLRTFESLSNEEFTKTTFSDSFNLELQGQLKTYASFDSTLYPHIIALRDEELAKGCDMFKVACFRFADVVAEKNKSKIPDIQKALILASTLINHRIDALFEETFATRKRKK